MNGESALQLGSVDAAIVRELRADGRMPFETLSDRVGLSRAAAPEIAAWQEVGFLARCLGPADLIGTAAAESATGLHEVFERLRGLPGLRLTETWIRLAHVKERDGT